MAKFAAYDPGADRAPRLDVSAGLVIRPGQGADLGDLAEIAAEREGEPLSKWRSVFERILAEPGEGQPAILLVAALAGHTVGYGKAAKFLPPEGSRSNISPEGWYLTGLVVRPSYRRRGIGLELTKARLARIAERSDRAYYFANERNRASIDLHQAVGFVELTRDFSHPGVRFTGGAGVLFVCKLRPSR